MLTRCSRTGLIIGAGVSGLTTAIALLKRGIRPKIVAEKTLSQTTSVIAGALWEWPPAVCGFHQNPISLKRSKSWARRSYDVFDGLSRNPATGVTMQTAFFFFYRRVEENAEQLAKKEEIRENTREFIHSTADRRERSQRESRPSGCLRALGAVD